MPILVHDREFRGSPAIFIGRSGVLGNPFALPTDKRLPDDSSFIVQTVEESRALYELHISELWDKDEYFRLVILSLVREQQAGHTVHLVCTDPEIGNILKRNIDEIAAFDVVEEEKPEPAAQVVVDQARVWLSGTEDPF